MNNLTRLASREYGDGPGDDAKPTLVLLHGFMGAAADWRSLAAALAPLCRCLCLDLPGHGAPLRPVALGVDAGMAEAASEVLRELDALGVGSCALAGYSMGGRAALYLALRHPERFSSIILESASPGLELASERCERRERDEALARRLETLENDMDGFADFLREWYSQPIFASLARQPKLRARLIHHRLRNHPPSLAAALRIMGTGRQPSLWEELGNLAAPVLLTAGDQDPRYARTAAMMAARLPRARLEIVNGCGHMPHLERPQRFAALAGAFLRRRACGVQSD